MTYWTADNTEGYTAEELNEMNRALDMLAAEGYENDEHHVSDYIHNTFVPGITADELVAAFKNMNAAYKAR